MGIHHEYQEKKGDVNLSSLALRLPKVLVVAINFKDTPY